VKGMHGVGVGPSEAQLRVRIAGSGDELSVTADVSSSVEAFKQQLKETGVAMLNDPNLQLVFGGRILADRTKLSDHSVCHGCCLLAISTRRRVSNLPIPADGAPDRAYGFERLIESGFSQEEVAQFRAQFLASSPSAQLLGAGSGEGSSRTERLQDLEEEWMNAQNFGHGLGSGESDLEAQRQPLLHTQEHVPIVLGPEGYPAASTTTRHSAVTGYGSNTDMLAGIVLGFLVPWMPLLFLVMDNAVMNRSFKTGLVTGVACNISLGIVKFVTFT